MGGKSLTSWVLAAAVSGVFVLGGCQEWQTNSTNTSLTTQPSSSAPAAYPVSGDGMSHSSIYVPTGVESTSVLGVVRSAPAEVTIGQVFPADITVTNLTANSINAVEVTDECATNFKLESSDPTVTKSDNGGIYHWNIGAIGPHESKTIKISGSAAGTGVLQNCLSVTYDQKTCLSINVVQPKLALTQEAPSEVLKCDPIPVKYTVTNNGTGTAHHVVIKNTLPDNAVTSDGKKMVIADVGDLEAGGSRAFTASLKATDVGTITAPSVVTADGNLSANASTATVVKAPKLEITKTGNEKIYAGRQISYDITLKNTGNGDAKDTVLEDTIPAGTKLISATNGVTADANGKVVWNLGVLKAGDSMKANVVVEADTIGDVDNVADAKAYCADTVTADAKTSVQGIPAILLEMVDITDPIEVGNVETYVITITNQGSATDTNIVVKGILEDSMEFSAADGSATAGTYDAASSTITFAPLGSLAPKEKAVFYVKVKAVKPGDVRFKTTLTTAELSRPVEKTESTNFYK